MWVSAGHTGLALASVVTNSSGEKSGVNTQELVGERLGCRVGIKRSCNCFKTSPEPGPHHNPAIDLHTLI